MKRNEATRHVAHIYFSFLAVRFWPFAALNHAPIDVISTLFRHPKP